MAESSNPLLALSDHIAGVVERTASVVVGVDSGGRTPASGIHWRAGVIVTAEETLERDESIMVTLPGGRQVAATLAGRDPSTDVAVLRVQPDGLASAETADATALRAGHIVLAIGSHDGAPIASLGIVGFAGGAWHSSRGGAIDRLLRLDLALNPLAEGGVLVDVTGHVLGMTVLGPRRRVLAIPSTTIDRAVEQLLSKGHIARGYLGAGLQNVRLGRGPKGPSDSGRGILIVSIDPEGPATRAGLLVGDIITAWNANPVTQVREVMRLLGPDSVGSTVDLRLLRAGAPADLKITIGERPLT
jgi:S1-C subfamily serine protease